MMKKIRLSLFGFLVSGFVAVSALGGLSLVKTAYADDVATVGKFVMKDGGSVRMAQDENDKTGIRWSAIIDQDFYNSLNVGEQAVEFGAVVTPARNLGKEELLTVDSKQAMTVFCSATEPKFNENGEFVFSASIVYDDLEESQKQEAYALELVARAYVKVGENYNYVENYSTTRSMRAIALAAVQSGEYNEDQLNVYYGKKNVNVVAENTGYYGNVDENSVFENKHNISGEIQAYIGAKPVNATITNDGIVVSNAGDLEEQKSYTLNVFDANGNVYSQPFVAATKVIRTAEDLAYFELKDITKVQGTSIVSSTKFDGYYVVANDIDATSYNHQVIKTDEARYKLTYKVGTDGNIPTKESGEYQKTVDNDLYKVTEVRQYTDRAIRGGLEGTFDGAGHTISNLTVIDQGLFGLVTSGTVKNVGFTNVNLKGSEYGMNTCLFAQNISDGRFENVYVQANEMQGGNIYYETTSDAGGNRALIATQLDGFYCFASASDTGNDRYAKPTFTNCVFEYAIKNAKSQYCYSYGLYAADASFGQTDKDNEMYSPKFDNVYVIANTTISVRNPSLVVWHTSKVILAENEANYENKLEKAKELIENEGKFNNDEAKANFVNTQVKVTTGIKRYTTAELMKAAGNNYETFAHDYWSVSDDGVLSWKKA